MTTGPKWSRGALEIVNNTYVVRNDLLFEYYSISALPYTEKDSFIRLEISPGIVSEGIAIIDDEMYDVSLHDLLRRRINVGKRRVNEELFGGDNTSTGDKPKKHKHRRRSATNPNEQGLSGLFGDEVGEAADMAWENQVNTLLQIISTEEGEEFEITGSSQSGRTYEGSTVQDILANP